MLRGESANGHGITVAPLIDLTDCGSYLCLTADMPGVSLDDIEVIVERGVLVLSGHRAPPQASDVDGDGTPAYRERRARHFYRQIAIGDMVDGSAAEASYRDGVLTVKLPKRSESTPRAIPVSDAS